MSSRGSIASLALLPVVLLMTGGCATEIGGEDPPAGSLHYPIGLAIGPDSNVLYVVNSNFNAEYKHGSIATVLLDRTDFAGSRVLGSAKDDPSDTRLLVESFGGNIAVESHRRSDDQGEFYRAYVPIRENNAVEVLRISELEVKGTDGETERIWGSLSSSGRIMTRRGDPFRAVLGLETECPGGQGKGLEMVPLLAVMHLARGELVFLDLDALDIHLSGGELEEGRNIVAGQVDLPGGINDMAVHPITKELYITSRFTSTIEVLTPDPGTLCFRCRYCQDKTGEDNSCEVPEECTGGWNQRGVTISNLGAGGYDMRGLAFSEDGSRLYVADRGPDSLLVVDTSIGDDGRPVDQLVDATALPASPASVEFVHRGQGTRDLVLVTCFDDGTLWILDSSTLAMLATVGVGTGPYELAVGEFDDSGYKAFVADFDSASIAVVDLNDGPTFGTVSTFIK